MKLPTAKIQWVEICTYAAFGKIEPHSHEFFHYLYVLAGAGEIEVGGCKYALIPRHMYLVSPGVVHSFQNTQEERMILLEIKFSYYDAAMEEKLRRLPSCIDTTGTPILSILHNIRRETIRGNSYAQEIIGLNMQEISLHLTRLSGGDQMVEDKDGFFRVMEYIENNLDCDINLQDLANIVCLEKTYFLKKFKLMTGVTPMVYTRKARINRARELLEFSDMNVTQIAEAVGFRSIHHFTRCFTTAVGVSPSRYKEKQKLNK